MTTTQTAENFLMGGGATSAKFEAPGDTTSGTITEAPEVRQQTDIQSGEPVFWPSGDPKMQLIVTLQTTLRDDADDDGKRRIYVKGKSLTEAVREAVKKTGARGLETGGTLTVTYTGDGQATQRGFNPPKLYTATYARPDTTAQSGEFLGVQATPAQPAPAATQAAAGPAQPSPEQIAALKAVNIDPKVVYPHYTG
jgi:hypothetical protein